MGVLSAIVLSVYIGPYIFNLIIKLIFISTILYIYL